MELEHSFLLVAFLMGTFSSTHCLHMCGVIVGTLTLSLKPEIRENKAQLFSFVLSYNVGRITSYTIGGFLIGILESIITSPLEETHGQVLMKLLSAAVMTGAGLYIAGWLPKFSYIEKAGSSFWKILEPFGRKLIPVESRKHAFLFGIIWGWLPCGLVYTALALAATSGSFIKSALVMMAFGLGTLPAVLGAGIMVGIISRLLRMQGVKQTVGIMLVALAIFSSLPWLSLTLASTVEILDT